MALLLRDEILVNFFLIQIVVVMHTAPAACFVMQSPPEPGQTIAEAGRMMAFFVERIAPLPGLMAFEVLAAEDGSSVILRMDFSALGALAFGVRKNTMLPRDNYGYDSKITLWFGVSAQLPDQFRLPTSGLSKDYWNAKIEPQVSPRLLLRFMAGPNSPLAAANVTLYPGLRSRYGGAGGYSHDPYALASAIARCDESANSVSKKPKQVHKASAVRVALEAHRVRLCRASRAINPRPTVGDRVIVATPDGHIRWGTCISVAWWDERRQARNSHCTAQEPASHGTVIRHMSAADNDRLQSCVLPLAQRAVNIGRACLQSFQSRETVIESAECFFDLTTVVMNCRYDAEAPNGLHALNATAGEIHRLLERRVMLDVHQEE